MLKRWLRTRRYLTWCGLILLLSGVAYTSTSVLLHNAKPSLASAEASPPSSVPPPPQSGRRARRPNLTLRPEAFNLSRRLGLRFHSSGRELSVMVGRLTVGSEQRNVRMLRLRTEEGERVEVQLTGGGQVSLNWSAEEGVTVAGNPVSGEQRALVERLVLDSPEQFVLAQLRGASYYTVARQVRPAEAGGADDYTGPLWDLVRVTEPARGGQHRPQSRWRLYYINTSTGLIDKVVSQEQAETLTAEVTEWVTQGDESVPRRIVWKRNNQTMMELAFSNVIHQPRP